jgi:hypothetical protein
LLVWGCRREPQIKTGIKSHPSDHHKPLEKQAAISIRKENWRLIEAQPFRAIFKKQQHNSLKNKHKIN